MTIEILIAIPEVGVNHLISLRISRITKYSIRLGIQWRCRTGLNPRALHITFTLIYHTGTVERTRHTKIIDITTKIAKQ